MITCSSRTERIYYAPTAEQSEKVRIMMTMNTKDRFYAAVDQHGHWSWLTAERDTDGSILSVKVHTCDEDHHFADLAVDEQTKVLDWIRANVFPRKTPLERSTSYGIKHTLARRTNIYVSNNQFKEAMLLCGFYPIEVDEQNWRYCISKNSPIFQTQIDGHTGLLIPNCVMEYAEAEWEFVCGVWQCSNCGYEGGSESCWYDVKYNPTLHKCPQCGAIMRVGAKEDDMHMPV